MARFQFPFLTLCSQKNKNNIFKRHCGSYKELNGISAFFMLVGFLFFQFLYIMTFFSGNTLFDMNAYILMISIELNFGRFKRQISEKLCSLINLRNK